MKIGSTELGGLSGGLYARLEEIGRFAFRVLVGADRSSRISLEYASVRLGAAVVGIPFGVIGGALLAAPFKAAIPGCSFGSFVGYAVVALVAEAVIAYVRKLRGEELDAASPRDKTKTFEQVWIEKRRELEARGYPPIDAAREAWWFATMRH